LLNVRFVIVGEFARFRMPRVEAARYVVLAISFCSGCVWVGILCCLLVWPQLRGSGPNPPPSMKSSSTMFSYSTPDTWILTLSVHVYRHALRPPAIVDSASMQSTRVVQTELLQEWTTPCALNFPMGFWERLQDDALRRGMLEHDHSGCRAYGSCRHLSP
jgi:hypothetical protein